MWNWGLLFVITFLASLLSAPMPAWLMFAALLGLFAWMHVNVERRLRSHARSLGHMDRWADTVEARLETVAPERPQGLFAAPGRGAHFLTAANDAPADTPPDLRALSEREMKDVLTRITRRDRAA